jgi:hypothetical protein
MLSYPNNSKLIRSIDPIFTFVLLPSLDCLDGLTGPDHYTTPHLDKELVLTACSESKSSPFYLSLGIYSLLKMAEEEAG